MRRLATFYQIARELAVKQRHIRLVASAAVIALGASVLAACSSAGSGQKTITVTSVYEQAWGASLEAGAASYNKSHPDSLVKIQSLPYPGYQPALQTQFVAGAGPDVALIEPPAITDFSSRGFLLPLSEALDAKVDGGKAWRDSFVTGNVSSMLAQDAKEYTIPWSNTHVKAIYRPDVFKEVGYDTYPATWGEFMKANQKLLDSGRQPFLSGLAGNEASLWWMVTPMLEAFYRPFTTEINARHAAPWKFDAADPESVVGEVYTADEKYVAFVKGITDPAKSPEFRKATELVLQMKPYIGDWSAFTGDKSNPAFLTGKTPQMLSTSSSIGSLIADAKKAGKDLPVDWAEQPSVTKEDWPGLTAGGVNPIAAVRNGFVVNKNSKNKELAIDFLRYITTADQVTQMYTKGWTVTEPKTFTIGEVSSVTGVNYPEGSQLTNEKITSSAQIPMYGFGMPPTYDQQDFDQFTSQFQQLFGGQVTLDGFLKQRSASNLAALERNLKLYSSEIDQKFIDENTK